MAACDCCQIVYACCVTKKDGELKNNNSKILLKLAACQYSGRDEYHSVYSELIKDEKVIKWLNIHNDPDYKPKTYKHRKTAGKNQTLLTV